MFLSFFYDKKDIKNRYRGVYENGMERCPKRGFVSVICHKEGNRRPTGLVEVKEGSCTSFV